MALLWVRPFDRLGKILFTVVAAGVLILELVENRYSRFFALVLCGCAGFVAATLINAAIKGITKKQRPLGEIKRRRNLLAPLMQYSFPSYHAQLGFTETFIASWFLYDIHWGFAVALFALAIITAYSRYVLKAHDVLDITSGTGLGLLTGLAVCVLLDGVNSIYIAMAALGFTLLLFFYIPERYFSKRMV